MALYLGTPRSKEDKDVIEWARKALNEIERASREQADIAMVAQDYTTTNVTALRTLDGASATLDNVRNFICTFIEDIKRRGREGKD